MNADNILKNIDYYLKVRDYAINTPMIDYQLHMSLINLVLDKLNQLADNYREITGDTTFNWSEYQFTKGD